LDRYKECGLEALTDRSRRPWRYGNQLPQQVEAAIVNLKREKPYWGARKIRERLLRDGSPVRVDAVCGNFHFGNATEENKSLTRYFAGCSEVCSQCDQQRR
jgi:hypothetical protein